MLDALLFAYRDNLIAANYGYDLQTCNIMASPEPPPGCGRYFLAICQGGTRSENDNCLGEYFSFDATLTMRVDGVPIDRLGDQRLASKLARTVGPSGEPSFNARCEQIRAFFHMAWGILQDANTNLIAMTPDATTVYGFCEPARYRGMDLPYLVGGDWFGAEPDQDEVGLVSALHFADARRFQPIALFV